MLPLVRSCTCRLLSSPQFKILRPVVVADTIPVVNLLMAFERTPQNLLHDLKPGTEPNANVLRSLQYPHGNNRDYADPRHTVACTPQEYAETGKLADESYTKLEAAGFPKDLVDQFVQGQKAVAEHARSVVFETIGGEKNFTAMSEWAAENASAADLAAYNKAVSSGDAATTKMAVEALYGRYTEAAGSAPKLLNAGETNPTGGSTFRSWHEVQTAMGDPRYGPDDAFTRALIAKLDRSQI